MNDVIKKRVAEFFEEIDKTTNSPEEAATFLTVLAACIGGFLHNNVDPKGHGPIIDNIRDGILMSAEFAANRKPHIHITVIQGNKK